MAEEPKQMPLLHLPEWYEEHWKQMPEFKQKNKMPFKSIVVHFDDRASMEKFAIIIDQRVGLDTKSIWYPQQEISHWDKEWIGAEELESLEEDSEVIDES